MHPYSNRGPLDCTREVDTRHLVGKSVVVTGGANGIGEEYTRAFVDAGAYVTIADIDEAGANKLVDEFPKSCQFAKCDVCQWEDQLDAFKQAAANSTNKSVDIVIANAGIGAPDAMAKQDDGEEPQKPSLKTLDVNLTGVMYTTKLALHYFQWQHAKDSTADSCLILQSSIAGYLDLPTAIQYGVSKYALRSMMKNLRRTSGAHGTRVNLIAPWFIQTALMAPQLVNLLTAVGADFAEARDCATAAVRLAADTSAHGRALGIIPRNDEPRGYVDLDVDDPDPDSRLGRMEEVVMKSLSLRK